MAFLKDPAVQGYLGEEVKDLCSTLSSTGSSMGLLGMTLSKFMTIVSRTKFAFDTGARFAACTGSRTGREVRQPGVGSGTIDNEHD